MKFIASPCPCIFSKSRSYVLSRSKYINHGKIWKNGSIPDLITAAKLWPVAKHTYTHVRRDRVLDREQVNLWKRERRRARDGCLAGIQFDRSIRLRIGVEIHYAQSCPCRDIDPLFLHLSSSPLCPRGRHRPRVNVY